METIKRDNKVYAILDKETNSFMQSFIALNDIQANRNFNIAKLNLKEQIKNGSEKDLKFIDNLELIQMKE